MVALQNVDLMQNVQMERADAFPATWVTKMEFAWVASFIICIFDENSFLENFADIDECTTGVAACGPHGICRNTEGDYDCDCLDGYINEGKQCMEYKQIGELGGEEILP